MATRGELRIGTSGYQYDHWRGVFYPPEIPKRRWFAHYAERFDAVEINNSFYGLPSAETFDAWREEAPEGFVFALKFSRFGSHMKKLLDPESTIGLFLENAEHLGPHLGPVLVQLPPRWKVNAARLDAFLRVAPRRVRWAVEFREPSWLTDEVYAVLERHGAALRIHDMIPNHPWRLTAGWTYVRFHGQPAFAGDYSREQLEGFAGELRAWLAAGKDVHAYFNNDLHGHAIHNALDLRRLLGDVVN